MTVGLKQRTGRPLQTYLSFSIADSWSGMYTVIQVDCVDRNFSGGTKVEFQSSVIAWLV